MAQPRKLHDRFFKQAKAEGYLARSAYKLKEIDDRKKILKHGDLVLDLGCAPGSWLQVVLERIGPEGAAVGIDLQKVDQVAAPNLRTIVGDIYKTTGDDLAVAIPAPGAEDAPHSLAGPASEPGSERKGGADRKSQGWSVEATPGSKAATPAGARASSDGKASADARPTTTEEPDRPVKRPRRRFDVVLSDMAPNTSGHGDDLLSVRLCRRVLELAVEALRPGGSLVMKVLEGAEFPALLKDTQKMFGEARAFKPEATREVSREIYIVAKTFRAAGARPPRA
jgi:23S rRNA (uridine2552-2'-O)-methyltransferase